MPVYRCEIDSPMGAQEVTLRIRSLVRPAPGVWQSIKESFNSQQRDGRPFIGIVEGDSFSVRRDIHYRNSFLPRIRGRITPATCGSTVQVSMTLHPFVGLFMIFWLGAVGAGTFNAFYSNRLDGAPILIPAGMSVFGTALTIIGFYPEAIKAHHLLERTVKSVAPDPSLKQQGAKDGTRIS